VKGTGEIPTTTGAYDYDGCADLSHISMAVIYIYKYHVNDPGVYASDKFSFKKVYDH
jgi:hypothetical protein